MGRVIPSLSRGAFGSGGEKSCVLFSGGRKPLLDGRFSIAIPSLLRDTLAEVQLADLSFVRMAAT
jgi:hypothetical protein